MQESFQLAHETLYLSVAITDLFMARRDVKREEMQLLGATAILLASKFYVSNDLLFRKFDLNNYNFTNSVLFLHFFFNFSIALRS